MLLDDRVDPGAEIETHVGIKAPFPNNDGVYEFYQIFKSVEDLIYAHWKIIYMTNHGKYPPDHVVMDRGQTCFWDGVEWVLLE